MNDYEKLVKLTEDSRVGLGERLKELLHTHLVLGQTRYVCRYGTLSDGHEKITEAQRYYQAIKELYTISCNIKSQRVLSMEAQADLMDAEERLQSAKKPSEKLRAEAAVMQANNRLMGALINVEDQMRMVDEYTKVITELAPIVEAKYPTGIEQAEEDNWKAVAEYRARRQAMGHNDNIHFVPLSPQAKAEVGLDYGRPELQLWTAIKDKEQVLKLSNGDVVEYVLKNREKQLASEKSAQGRLGEDKQPNESVQPSTDTTVLP